jgi:hypothetical protein
MKTYCRFKILSTGYIQGSIPPKFSDEHKKPIDLLGSDGVFVLDSRKNVSSMIFDIEDRISKHMSKSSIIGFEIVKATNFRDKGRIIYSKLF